MFVVNRFGSGQLYSMAELIEIEGKTDTPLIYCTSTACMSVTSDMMSWWSGNENDIEKVAFVKTNKPDYNNVIIVLGCQVTDLAILNDIKTAEKLHNQNPKAKVYMGGCLAYRFDIKLPEYINRLAATRSENTEIKPEALEIINWEKPFWVKDWNESDSEFSDGHIFRNMYPLKIGAGCHGKCKYCTIRDTRGDSYELDPYLQIREFLSHDNVVLISDSPTIKQIKDWAGISERYNKEISIRNIEPSVLIKCKYELIELANKKLLRIVHCPIQSSDPELIKLMNRSVDDTQAAIHLMDKLRGLGVIVATNIIIDYTVESKTFKNLDVDWMNKHFDYWSWNPYFDGHWDRENAEERFNKYINNK